MNRASRFAASSGAAFKLPMHAYGKAGCAWRSRTGLSRQKIVYQWPAPIAAKLGRGMWFVRDEGQTWHLHNNGQSRRNHARDGKARRTEPLVYCASRTDMIVHFLPDQFLAQAFFSRQIVDYFCSSKIPDRVTLEAKCLPSAGSGQPGDHICAHCH